MRTAVSRLAADGWLERNRIGRNSFYRLAGKGRARFDAAMRQSHPFAMRAGQAEHPGEIRISGEIAGDLGFLAAHHVRRGAGLRKPGDDGDAEPRLGDGGRGQRRADGRAGEGAGEGSGRVQRGRGKGRGEWGYGDWAPVKLEERYMGAAAAAPSRVRLDHVGDADGGGVVVPLDVVDADALDEAGIRLFGRTRTGDELLRAVTGGGLDPDPLLRYLGLEKRRPYQTRHTTATLMLASGENPEWIARVLADDPARAPALYEAVTDLLADLATHAPPGFVAALDGAELAAQAGLFNDWYVPVASGPGAGARRALTSRRPSARSREGTRATRFRRGKTFVASPQRQFLRAGARGATEVGRAARGCHDGRHEREPRRDVEP